MFLLPLLVLALPALAQRYTTTIDGEVVLATVFTEDGERTTSIYDTIDVAEPTATTTRQTTFTPSGSISFDTTDTYYAPKPTRIATLGSHAPLANGGQTSIIVTAPTVAVPAGTRQDLGSYQSAIISSQATATSGAGARAGAGAAPVVAALAAVYALV